MPVKTLDEIMANMNKVLGERTDDDALDFILDVSDTIADLSLHKGDYTKEQYDELDSQWRKKYRDRFFSGSRTNDEQFSSEDEKENDEEERSTSLTIKDLFTTK